ncbi:hypothetical protein [Rhodococcus sp. ACT016]|uniref:hypothetical protein n=1 Tax=Rhodococcus sp. ACT016 TaxID=3134808 RepID=UPI003D26BD67
MGTDTFAKDPVPPEAHTALAESDRTKHRLFADLAAALLQAQVRRLDDAGHSCIVWFRQDAAVQVIRE